MGKVECNVNLDSGPKAPTNHFAYDPSTRNLCGSQYLRQIRRIKRWVNRIWESFRGEFPTIHTTYDRDYRTAGLF